jgi:hypothetical protein
MGRRKWWSNKRANIKILKHISWLEVIGKRGELKAVPDINLFIVNIENVHINKQVSV